MLINKILFEIKLMFKSPVTNIYTFLYPFLFTLIIGYLTQNNFNSNFTSYEFYCLGMMIFTFMGTGITCAYNYIEPNLKEGNLRICFTPISKNYIFLSQIIAGTIYSSLGVLTTMILNELFFLDYNQAFIPVLLSFISLIFLSNTLGILLCNLLNHAGLINMIYNLLQSILCIIGGVFFSFESLGEIPAIIAKFSPIKWLMDGLLYSIYDNTYSLLNTTSLICILIGFIFIVLSTLTFKTERYLAQ